MARDRARTCVCVFRAEEGGTSKGAGRPPLIKLIQVGGGVEGGLVRVLAGDAAGIRHGSSPATERT